MKVLVVAVTGVAGKTAVASGIARGLLIREADVGVMKPFSIHDWYMDYDNSAINLKRRAVFSRDALRLAEAAKLDELPLELLNPVHGVTLPPSASYLLKGFTAHYFSLLSNLMSRMVLARVSLKGDVFLNIYLVNEEPLLKGYVEESLPLRILSPKTGIQVKVSSSRQLQSAINLYGAKAVVSCFKVLSRMFSYLIVEGFADVATPPLGLHGFDLVLTVAPGYVLVYNGDKYLKATEVLGAFRSSELKVRDIVEVIRPSRVFKIPPIASNMIKEYDSLALRLEDLVEYIIDLEDKLFVG